MYFVSSIFQFYFIRPPKRCLIISHSQKIFQICFTISVESSITFPNVLVLAVLNWAPLADLRLEDSKKKPRAKSNYVP